MVFAKLLVCLRGDVLLFEQRAIDRLRPRYNLLANAGHSTGWRHTDAVRAAFTQARTGVVRGPMSVETREKIRAAQAGKPRAPHTAEWKEEARLRSTAAMADPAARDRLSALHKGKPLSAEHKAKIGLANKGRAPSRTAIEKSAEAKRGKKQSEETKAKRLASYLAAVERRRNAADNELRLSQP